MFQEEGKIRVIEGPEKDGPVHDGDYRVEPDVIVSKFKKFVREFTYNGGSTGSNEITRMKYR